jgi:uncharacterized protein (DUF4415 family)
MKTVNIKGREYYLPSEEEDARITEAAMSDPDCRPYSDEEWESVRSRLYFGNPLNRMKKEPVTMRLDSDVLAFLRGTGRGWQTKVNQVLRDWMASHPKSI